MHVCTLDFSTHPFFQSYSRVMPIMKANCWEMSQHMQCMQARCPYCHISPNSITLTLRQSPRQVPDKVVDTNHESLQHKSRRRLSRYVSATSPQLCRELVGTLSQTFPVHCNGLNCIRVTQTGLSRTCHRLCCKPLNMLRWFVSATFVICVGDFHRNFMISWSVTVCVRDLHDLCL